MSETVDEDLRQRTKALLEPGDIALDGLILHTDYDGSEDVQMMQATIDVGDLIAEHVGEDPQDCFVHSGNDDPDFSSNQHQGLTLDGEEFVWECQQLLRDGSFDVVFYYEATDDQASLLDAVEAEGFEVTGVKGED